MARDQMGTKRTPYERAYAAFHETGTSNLPPRPFIAPAITAETRKQKIAELLEVWSKVPTAKRIAADIKKASKVAEREFEALEKELG